MKSLFPDLLKASSLGFENMDTTGKAFTKACTSHTLPYNENPEITNFSGVALRKVSSSAMVLRLNEPLPTQNWLWLEL